jgi:hypothetical protein
MTPFIHKLLLVAVGCGLVVVVLTRKSPNGRLETKVPVASASIPYKNPVSTPDIPLPPPTLEDVRRAVARIYGDTVKMDSGSPGDYMVGDFNGDGSPDLVVEVLPARDKIPDLNDQLANWILEDPSQIFVPDPSKRVQTFPPKPSPPRVRARQSLLVIVHGYGAHGWREPNARQSYLLVNAAGDSMALERKESAITAKAGSQPMPRLLGDVIHEARRGRQGFLYWTGGHYAWYQL